MNEYSLAKVQQCLPLVVIMTFTTAQHTEQMSAYEELREILRKIF